MAMATFNSACQEIPPTCLQKPTERGCAIKSQNVPHFVSQE
jgi:hypothetical protein